MLQSQNMAPMSRGEMLARDKKVVYSKKKKPRTTPSSKQHRFESFSDRIGRLTIHPVRRSDAARIYNEDVDKSYFRTSLEDWKDTNLSGTFTDFAHEVSPLCQSLPQLLHHQEKIVTILIQYIEKKDTLALEPLLDLVVQFAHDLGRRFEIYFSQCVPTIIHLAATHSDAEAIEWSFNCLAWLFKYLCQLLTPDLRPLFDLMAPLLGKTRQKGFISRFAAEALSFLIKKSASIRNQEPLPLQLIIDHACNDLVACEDSQKAQYSLGLANLFAESIKGIQRQVHMNGPKIFDAMRLKQSTLYDEQHVSFKDWSHVVRSTTINIVHNTDDVRLSPLLATLLKPERNIQLTQKDGDVVTRATLLFAMVGTRKGTRISQWSDILDCIFHFIKTVNTSEQTISQPILSTLLSLTVVAFTYCPFDILLPRAGGLLQEIGNERWRESYLAFCVEVSELNPDRFRELMALHFRRFITSNWSEYRDAICLFQPQIQAMLPHTSTPDRLPASLMEEIKSTLGSLGHANAQSYEASRVLVYSCSRCLSILQMFSLDHASRTFIESALMQLLQLDVNQSDQKSDVVSSFVWTHGILTLAKTTRSIDMLAANWPLLCKGASSHGASVSYLTALSAVLSDTTRDLISINHSESQVLKSALIKNLKSPLHELRLASLDLLYCVSYKLNYQDGALREALSIEKSPLTYDHSRSIALAIRKMATSYATAFDYEWLKEALPIYCFGILHINFTSAWDEACDALAKMVEFKDAENIVTKQALEWLGTSHPAKETVKDTEEADPIIVRNDFECSNLMSVENLLASTADKIDQAPFKLNDRFHAEFEISNSAASNQRLQALKVLKRLPHLAEKRSRILVPVLLAWTSENHAEQLKDFDEISRTSEDPGSSVHVEKLPETGNSEQIWSRREQKELLDIFASFTNPLSLYRSQDVFDALMKLLCNGDGMIQKAALKALSIWKNTKIKRYEEHLMNLLDDTRFREELTVFLDLESEKSIIQLEDRTNLMPIILRLLYGRVISRTTSSTKHGGQYAKRVAVLSALHRLTLDELSQFIAICLGSLDNIPLTSQGKLEEYISQEAKLSQRKQSGLLRLIADMVDVLAGHISIFSDRLLGAILYCSIRATRETTSSPDQDPSDSDRRPETALSRSIKQDSMHSICTMFSKCDVDEKLYTPLIVDQLITPRLDRLPVETAQGISSILKLVSIWSEFAVTSRLICGYRRMLEKISECLTVPFAKAEVKLFVLDKIIANLGRLASDDRFTTSLDNRDACDITREALRGGLGLFFIHRIIDMLRSDPPKECLESGVKALILLESCARTHEDERTIIRMAITLLRRPIGQVGIRLKSELLLLLKDKIVSESLQSDAALYDETVNSVAELFSFFQDARNRSLTVTVFTQLVQNNKELFSVGQRCVELNAYTTTRLSEPDFDRRLEAFRLLTQEDQPSMNSRQWYPIVQNMLFFIKDQDELAVRSGAGMVLKQFIRQVTSTGTGASSLGRLLEESILPAVQKGLRASSEPVRSEYISLLSTIITAGLPDLLDLQCLLGPDVEASFFNNILHIQQHRRIRALKRLGSEALNISPKNMSRFCLPLIENYIDRTEDSASNLTSEAIIAYEKATEALDWQRYRQVLNRWVLEASKLDSKLHIRVLGATVNAIFNTKTNESDDEIRPHTALADSLPDQHTMAAVLTKSVLEKILEQIHFKDESTVDIRVLLAVIAVKLIKVFPEEHAKQYLPRLLIDVCNVLKSKAQEARDITRKTLAEIAAISGHQYFHFIIKQLRSSLPRGAQLHVLSFTVHSLLVSVSTQFKVGQLDSSLHEIMQLVVEDVFGAVAQEKEAKDYVSKMKEVRKKSLGYDSLELVASLVPLNNVIHMIKPIEEQIMKPRPKTEKIEELLRRLREGLRKNPEINSRDFLVLCYEIFHRKSGEKDQTGTSPILIAFALDLLRRALDKHEDLKTVENLAGMIPTLNSALRIPDEGVQISAMKCITSIIKIPISAIDSSVSTYLDCVKLAIESSSSTSTTLAQSALKLMAAILRDRPQAIIKYSTFEKDISYVLGRIKPDLREPAFMGDRDRQVAAFNLLRAVLGRGIVMKETYEVMEVVREVMITSSDHPIPDLARGAYSRFVLDYFPEEGKGFSKELDYLNSNLQYPTARGRRSIMEVLLFVLNKMSDTTAQQIITQFFLPLVVIHVSDDTEDCRNSAEILLTKMFERADKEHIRLLKNQMQNWTSNNSDDLWKQAGFLCWKAFFGVHNSMIQDAKNVHQNLAFELVEASLDASTWSTRLHLAGLDLLLCLANKFPSICLAESSRDTWQAIIQQLNHSSSEIVARSADLIKFLLTDFAKATVQAKKQMCIIMMGSTGLKLDTELALLIVKQSFKALRKEVDPAVLEKITHNISFIGRASTGDENADLMQQILELVAVEARRESGTTPPRARLAVLKLLGSWCNEAMAPALQAAAHDIVLPLQNLTDNSRPTMTSTDPEFAPIQEDLVATAQELLTKLQNILGSFEFLKHMSDVQREIRDRREKRRIKRRIDAVTAPEKTERLKRKKHDASKMKRKMKNALHAGKRRGY